MHKIFGEKENVDYIDRKGAYLIVIHEKEIGLVKTNKGLFLLGGGNKDQETDIDCLKRECLEEIGYEISVKYKLCSAEMYCVHETIGHFHPMQTYYVGELVNKVKEKIEDDHELVWIKYDDIKDKMYLQMQRWAIGQAIGTYMFKDL